VPLLAASPLNSETFPETELGRRREKIAEASGLYSGNPSFGKVKTFPLISLPFSSPVTSRHTLLPLCLRSSPNWQLGRHGGEGWKLVV